MFLRCFFSTTQIIRNFRIFRHAHLATGIVGIIRHLVVRPRTARTWKTQVLKIIEEFYISVYTGIELNWKNACDSKQPRFVFMWYVYIGNLIKKRKTKMITVTETAEFVWELSSPEYVVCQCFTWYVMTDKSWMSLTIYRKLWICIMMSYSIDNIEYFPLHVDKSSSIKKNIGIMIFQFSNTLKKYPEVGWTGWNHVLCSLDEIFIIKFRILCRLPFLIKS